MARALWFSGEGLELIFLPRLSTYQIYKYPYFGRVISNFSGLL
jgi:hypothetical protein